MIRFLLLSLLLIGFVLPVHGEGRRSQKKRGKAPVRLQPDLPVLPPISAGLQTNLSTSGYQFTQIVPLPDVRMAMPSFQATASVLNQSQVGVPFAFAGSEILGRSWNFRLYDAEGLQVWQSEPENEDMVASEPITHVLLPGRALSRAVTIPLWLEDGPLAPGRYTVEAVLLSDVPLVLTSLISILPAKNSPPPLGRFGSVNGLVVHADRDPVTGLMRPAGGMRVTISPKSQLVRPDPDPSGGIVVPFEVTVSSPGDSNPLTILPRDPFPKSSVWNGFTKEDGTFDARLLPGDYVVNVTPAFMIMIYPPPPMPTGEAEITIRADETTETTIVLSQSGQVFLHP